MAWYWWPFWMLLLAVGLVAFYGALTPAWMAFRGFAWLSERGLPRRTSGRAGSAPPAGP